MIKKLIIVLCVIVGFAALLFGGFWYVRHQERYPSTDDAYVHAAIVHVAAQVSGPVVKLPIKQYQMVKANQLLFEMDPAPFRLAEQQAHDHYLAALQANQVKQQQLAQAKLLVSQRHAEWHEAKRHAERMHALSKTRMVATVEVEQADDHLAVAKAALHSAMHQQSLAASHLGGVREQDPAVHEARVLWQQAQLHVAHAQVRAPAAGQVATLPIHVGSMITAGQPLFALVETGKWWVIANFKETQMRHIRVGQKATVHVDLTPDQSFQGRVSALSRGSGQSFSLLPAENATGNWVKVTQRFSVRIALDHLDGVHSGLRDGASAEVSIDARPLDHQQRKS